MKYGDGIHPKHSLTKYHQFFIDRIKNGKNIQKISGAKTFLIRVLYFKRDWEVAFRRELKMYYFSDNDHKIEHTVEELKSELSKVNLVMQETKTVWGEIWTKCEYDI